MILVSNFELLIPGESLELEFDLSVLDLFRTISNQFEKRFESCSMQIG